MNSITSKRLRQIIVEEIKRHLREADGEPEVPAGKKMVQAASAMTSLKDALLKFKETSPEAATAIQAQIDDLESMLDTKLEPLSSLVSPSTPSAKFAGSQGLQAPPEEEDVGQGEDAEGEEMPDADVPSEEPEPTEED